MSGMRQLRGWRVDLRRRKFRWMRADGAREVVPFDSPCARDLNEARWERERAIPRIPRDAWWLARLSNILVERYGQWIAEEIVDYDTPQIMWFVRQVYWAGKRDGVRSASESKIRNKAVPTAVNSLQET